MRRLGPWILACATCACSALRLGAGPPVGLQCQMDDVRLQRFVSDHADDGLGIFSKDWELLLQASNGSQYWAGKRFPMSRASIKEASRPHGHTGALLRLSTALAKLVQNRDQSLNPEQTMTIVVLGNSMTEGMGWNTPWPLRLELLSAALHYPVKVINIAARATTSRWALSRIAAERETLERADIVLVDYSITDQVHTYNNGWGQIASSFRQLMVALLRLPQKPAVVALETIVFDNSSDVATCDTKKTDVATCVHWDIEIDLRIPVVSYPMAVCGSGDLHWFLNAKSRQEHPNDVTHDLVARAMMGFFLLQMDLVAHYGVIGHDRPDESPSEMAACLLDPTTAYHASHRRSFQPVARDVAWRFEEDVPGKPGWIASALAPLAKSRSTSTRGWAIYRSSSSEPTATLATPASGWTRQA
mmetsp:Transcript_35553/g.96390  ORF Transcript_35553/g.96390 Transcript_35553/m.96390 type:complete len:417 (-) Transcript_35553:255-1505(-)